MEILAIGRRAGSGTRDTFHEIIFGSKEAEAPGVYMEAGESSEVKTAIRGGDITPSATWAIAILWRGDTRVVALDGVKPTIQTIKNGTYPLARKLYLTPWAIPGQGQEPSWISCSAPRVRNTSPWRMDSYLFET